MTLEELRKSEKDMVTAEDVAPIIGCNPHAIRVTARNNPKWLGFPVVCVGNRVKIPRAAFIRHITGGTE